MKQLLIKFADPTTSAQLTLADLNGFYKFEALRNYGELGDSKRPLSMQEISANEFLGSSIRLADNSKQTRVNAIKNFFTDQGIPPVAPLDPLP